ncbi:hypothetical protein Pse7367_0406 [Thalassoporum mexicanum PCC 7367]|uniref:DUF2779 domain-containing protein n=1 Tax=Thalassoporum mexicanum TaxID=3457544 RepID=UPI00029F9FC3|nr:DUF2779 domain-containing protein [Pseudanabaena sp. PCC 7367]AFY68717.1 hypothetical protein Pse7367_0406 [Pseudanabaena sp. PCC 7367]
MTEITYLSRFDYKTAKSCATKLYYRKQGYPRGNRQDNYSRMLSDGRFIIAKTARLLYPDGIAIVVDQSFEQGIAQTQQELAKENVVLFEPVIFANYKLIRPDILVKRGDRIELIEVRVKAFNSEENAKLEQARGLNIFRSKRDRSVNSLWRNAIEEMAFQVHTLQELLVQMGQRSPNLEIIPHFMMPDLAQPTAIDNLADLFKITKTKSQATPSSFSGVDVQFLGDQQQLEQLRKHPSLALVNIKSEVAELLPRVVSNVQTYLNSIVDGLEKIETPIDKGCKNCEYRASPHDDRDGFKECWQELAEVEPHILDLYHIGRVGGVRTPLVNEMIQQGNVSMFDLPPELLEESVYRARQLVQLKHTSENSEWISGQLPEILTRCKYPLHFIDFETSRLAIAPNKQMPPFERVAFQWSCHTIPEPDAEPIHTDWLNTSDQFPNFKFARALMEQLGTKGTIFTWAPHENAVLRDIHNQMEIYGYEDPELKQWLRSTAQIKKKGKSKLKDMYAITLEHYFHPLMKARTSLKCVLPAIWKTNSYLHELNWLKDYFKKEGDRILSPYEALPNLEISDRSVGIKEGTEAMLAYQEILYGQSRDRPDLQAKWTELLKQYCCLDTLAMVVIWLHWHYLASENAADQALAKI